MNPTTCVLAPFRAPTHAGRAWNTARAEAIVTLLHAEGVPAWCIHSSLLRGVYGDDADPEARARGLAASGALAATFPRAFVLLRDDGSMSGGTRADALAWTQAHPDAPLAIGEHYHACRWSDLRDRFEAAGLGDLWAELVVAPDAVGPWERRRSWFRTYGGGNVAAYASGRGWIAYDEMERRLASGPETGADGRAAADAALRAAGVPLAGEVTRG